MNKYQHLTADERHQITAMRRLHYTQAEIAKVMSRSPSTISRESGAMSLVMMDGTELRKRKAMRLHADRSSVVGHGLAPASGIRSRLC